MEEQILKILCKAYPNFANNGNISKEITSHITEFIMWLKDECEVVFERETGKYVFTNDELKNINYNMNIEEVYQYWLIKVKNEDRA